MDIQQIANDIMDAKRCGERWFPHDLWTQLRAEPSPLWLEPEGYEGFWAIVKHADLKEISTQPDKFINGPRSIIIDRQRDMMRQAVPIRFLIDMDPPDHRSYRKFVNEWFIPRNIRKLEDRMRRSAVDLCDQMAAHPTWEGDFVAKIAAIHPVRMITYLFGLPDGEEQQLIRIANAMFGLDDPEFTLGEGLAGMAQLIMEAMNYFGDLYDDRRAKPGEDLASAIANAEIDGEPIGRAEAIGYYAIILSAGHETTRTAMSGGVHAMLANPAEFRKLKANPRLVRSAVEEMVRWTSPVNQFGRTATEDYVIRGQTIKKGESVCLFYGSANRDEEVFDAPFEFRVDRDPNPHLGFGVGEHFCLGAALARMEMVGFFEEFAARVDVDSLEQTGEVEYLASNFVGGVKHFPLKCAVSRQESTLATGAA